MRICAEMLFAINAAIDAGLLACSARLCGEQLRWKRLALAGVLGGSYAVAAMLPGFGFLQHWLVRICAAGLMGLIAFGASVRLCRLLIVFAASACGFAGLVLAVTQLTGSGLLILPGGSYYPVSAMALAAVGAVSLAVCRLMFSSCAQHTPRAFEELTLVLGEQKVHLRALIDTGNTLKDPLSNEPVLVADWTAAKALLPDQTFCRSDFENAPELMRRLARQQPELRLRLIPFRSVGVSWGMLLAVRCRAEGRNGRKPVLVAFSPTQVSGHGESEALTGGAV